VLKINSGLDFTHVCMITKNYLHKSACIYIYIYMGPGVA
jgi:hypothetical protein